MIPVFYLFLIKDGLAQDIEKVMTDTRSSLRKEAVSLTGSIGANSVFYRSFGIQPRRDPFYWVLNANLNFLLFNKISVPFTAVITQQDKNYSNGLDKFSQPFNQFGISPNYRWLTLHAGYRSLEFSEYSLSGAMFLGGGVEIKPERSNVSGAAFYGRFVKAVPEGGVDGIVVSLPAYERWGGGAKIRIGTEQNSGEIIFLKIKDNAGSVPFDTSFNISPQENQVISLSGKQHITRWLSAGAEAALSMFTKNTYSDITKLQRFTYINQVYTPRTSSQFNKALTATLDFSPGKTTFGIKYKRIDPDYQTLGAIFLTNDVEELSLHSTFLFLQNRLNVSTASGLQQNNLDKIQVLTSRRAIASLNLSYNISSQLNLSGNYSNFSSNALPVRDVFSDTIRFVQLTQNGSFAASYSLGGEKLKHQFSNVYTYQESGGNKQALSVFFNGTFSYQLSIGETGWGINTSLIYNRTSNGGFGVTEGYGPQMGVNKTLLRNKIRLMLNAGFQNAFLNNEALSKNTNANFSFGYTIDKHQSLRLECSWLERSALKAGAQQFSEIRGSIGYSYNFGVKSRALIRKKTDE